MPRSWEARSENHRETRAVAHVKYVKHFSISISFFTLRRFLMKIILHGLDSAPQFGPMFSGVSLWATPVSNQINFHINHLGWCQHKKHFYISFHVISRQFIQSCDPWHYPSTTIHIFSTKQACGVPCESRTRCDVEMEKCADFVRISQLQLKFSSSQQHQHTRWISLRIKRAIVHLVDIWWRINFCCKFLYFKFFFLDLISI